MGIFKWPEDLLLAGDSAILERGQLDGGFFLFLRRRLLRLRLGFLLGLFRGELGGLVGFGFLFRFCKGGIQLLRNR